MSYPVLVVFALALTSLAAITVLGLVAFVSIVYRYPNLVSEAIQALKELMRWLLRK